MIDNFIKLTNDNILFWSKAFPILVIFQNILCFILCANLNIVILNCFYVLNLIFQFVFIKIWKLFLIKDLYVSKNKKFVIGDFNDPSFTFTTNDVIAISSQFGISSVKIKNDSSIKIYYFILNSTYNAKYLKEVLKSN